MPPPFKCVCREYFAGEVSLSDHISQAHLGYYPWACDFCGDSYFVSKLLAETHRDLCHSHELDPIHILVKTDSDKEIQLIDFVNQVKSKSQRKSQKLHKKLLTRNNVDGATATTSNSTPHNSEPSPKQPRLLPVEYGDDDCSIIAVVPAPSAAPVPVNLLAPYGFIDKTTTGETLGLDNNNNTIHNPFSTNQQSSTTNNIDNINQSIPLTCKPNQNEQMLDLSQTRTPSPIVNQPINKQNSPNGPISVKNGGLMDQNVVSTSANQSISIATSPVTANVSSPENSIEKDTLLTDEKLDKLIVGKLARKMEKSNGKKPKAGTTQTGVEMSLCEASTSAATHKTDPSASASLMPGVMHHPFDCGCGKILQREYGQPSMSSANLNNATETTPIPLCEDGTPKNQNEETIIEFRVECGLCKAKIELKTNTMNKHITHHKRLIKQTEPDYNLHLVGSLCYPTLFMHDPKSDSMKIVLPKFECNATASICAKKSDTHRFLAVGPSLVQHIVKYHFVMYSFTCKLCSAGYMEEEEINAHCNKEHKRETQMRSNIIKHNIPDNSVYTCIRIDFENTFTQFKVNKLTGEALYLYETHDDQTTD